MRIFTLGLFVAVSLIAFILYSNVISEPSFNGSTPGCTGGGCHSLQNGLVSATLNGLDIRVSVSGTSSRVGGELIDSNGNVVDVVNSTNSNPFTLTAPQAGEYRINAGFKNPNRRWDSLMVAINLTGIDTPEPGPVAARFELYPNHPNPFNSETIIRFSLPDAGNVNLTIYDIRGQVIKHLSEGYYQAGTHSLRWDGRNDAGDISASGVYLIEVRSGEQRSVRRMILAK